jgi:hypothetical protein
MYFKLDNEKFDYYQVPKSVSYNPWAFVVYRKKDATKTPIFVLNPDGRVKLLNNYYILKYSTFKDYIVLKLFDKHYNEKIGELLLRLHNDFLIR